MKALGAVLPFDEERADFSFIDKQNRLVVSNVIHQATIEVNEEGSEATAATAVVMRLKRAAVFRPNEPINFFCNRPFLFMIHDKSKHSILFYGRYSRP